MEIPQTQTPEKKLQALYNILTQKFIGREREALAALAGLVSSQPTFFCGPPGTAKTALVEYIARSVNAKYFYYLLTRFTTPEELLGPLDVKALREGKYVRITKGRLPEAEIVFLDEVFKASSAVRNILLDIILNRRYLNGTEYVRLPMIALYTASNEISTDSEDAAFYDRLVIRSFVKYVEEPLWEHLLTAGVELTTMSLEEKINGNGSDCEHVKPIMTVNDVKALQVECIRRAREAVANSALRSRYIEALAILKSKNIEVSDRRKVQVLLVAAAISIIYGEPRVSTDSVADALLFCAPFNEDDIPTVEQVCYEARLFTFAEQAKKINVLVQELENAIKDLQEQKSLEAFKRMKQVHDKLVEELGKMQKSPRTAALAARALETVRKANEVIRSVLG